MFHISARVSSHVSYLFCIISRAKRCKIYRDKLLSFYWLQWSHHYCIDCRPDLIFNQSPHTKCKLSVLWIKQTTFQPFLGFPQKILSSVVFFYANASLWHQVTKIGGLSLAKRFPMLIGGSFHNFTKLNIPQNNFQMVQQILQLKSIFATDSLSAVFLLYISPEL